MLGRPILDDPFTAQPVTTWLRAEQDLRAQVARLRAQLDTSTQTLHVATPNVRRVVDTALALAGQPPLVDGADGLLEAPNLTRGWERTLLGLEDPLDPEVRRPFTFAADRAGPDVVHAHLGSALVDQAQRLLRSAVWGETTTLTRVTGVTADLPEEVREDELLVTVVTRMLLVGADGARLHEEIQLAARAVPMSGRSRRIEVEERRLEALRATVEAALEPDACRPSDLSAGRRLAEQWPELAPQLGADIAARATVRRSALERDLQRREADELARVDAVTAHMRRTLTDALAEPAPRQLALDELDEPERRQVDTDHAAWRARLDGLEDERLRERETVARRYEGVRELTFPGCRRPADPTRDPMSAGAAAARRHAWLELLQTAGPFLTIPVADQVWPAGIPAVPQPLRTALRAAVTQVLTDSGASRQALAREVLQLALGWGEALIEGAELPAALSEPVAEHGLVLRPDFAFHIEADTEVLELDEVDEVETDEEESDEQTTAPSTPATEVGPWHMLGMWSPWGTHPLRRTVQGGWTASPVERLAVLLRARDVPLGLVSDGRWWAIVHAPRGKPMGVAVWDASLWSEEPETLAGFVALLDRRRFVRVMPAEQLPALLSLDPPSK